MPRNGAEAACPRAIPRRKSSSSPGLTPGSGTITATNNIPGTLSLNALVLAGNGSSATVNISGGSLSLVSNGNTPPAIHATSPAGSVWNVGSAISLGLRSPPFPTMPRPSRSAVFSAAPADWRSMERVPVSITGTSANTFSGDTTLLGGASLTLGEILLRRQCARRRHHHRRRLRGRAAAHQPERADRRTPPSSSFNSGQGSTVPRYGSPVEKPKPSADWKPSSPDKRRSSKASARARRR